MASSTETTPDYGNSHEHARKPISKLSQSDSRTSLQNSPYNVGNFSRTLKSRASNKTSCLGEELD